jgi:hypothetical protein
LSQVGGSRAPIFALATVSVLAGVWFLVLTDGEYFFSDEWSRFSFFPNASLEWALHGTNGHLIFFNVLLYRAVLEIFGAESYLPFRLICLVLQISVVWLLFFYLRARVNGWLIVACVTPLLFLGSAWVVTASAYGIVILTPIVLGLGSLIAVDRRTTSFDLLASFLLVCAVLSHSGGLPFLVGVLVLVLITERSWSPRIWIVAPALATFLGWSVWTRALTPEIGFFEDPVAAGNFTHLPAAFVDTPAAALAAVTGAFYRLDASGDLDFNLYPGYALLVVASIGIFWLWRRSATGISPRVFVPVAMLFTFAFLIAFGMSDPDRQATSPRYLYFTVLCVIWIFCELSPAIRWRPLGVGVLLGTIGLGLLTNASIYGKSASSLREFGATAKAVETALAIAGPKGYPFLQISDVVAPFGSAGAFSQWTTTLDRRSIEEFGSVAYSRKELRAESSETREIVDSVLVALEQIQPRRVRDVSLTGRCRFIRTRNGSVPREVARVAPGGSIVLIVEDAQPVPVPIEVLRFGERGIEVGAAALERAFRVSFPVDRSARPWRVALPGGAGARLCSEG